MSHFRQTKMNVDQFDAYCPGLANALEDCPQDRDGYYQCCEEEVCPTYCDGNIACSTCRDLPAPTVSNNNEGFVSNNKDCCIGVL